MEEIKTYLEALIFATTEPIRLEEMKRCIEHYTEREYSILDVRLIVRELQQKYEEDTTTPFKIVHVAKGYQFVSKAQYNDIISLHIKQKSKRKLSKSAMETLAIIAYKQPISKGELAAIRGVSSDYAIQKLLEKELIEIKGRSKELGRALLYGTSNRFMQHFGLKTMRDLPQLKELKVEENQIGIPVEE